MATDLTLNGGAVLGGGLTLGDSIVGTDAAFTGAVGAQQVNTTTAFTNPKAKITVEGGFAVKLTNKTGAPSVKGQIVGIKAGTDNAFDLTAVDAAYNFGVVYESGIADAAECWVVVGGIAEVLMKNAATRGQMCRVGLTADEGEAAGYAMAAAQSSTASAYKIGDCLESKDAEALCKVLLH